MAFDVSKFIEEEKSGISDPGFDVNDFIKEEKASINEPIATDETASTEPFDVNSFIEEEKSTITPTAPTTPMPQPTQEALVPSSKWGKPEEFTNKDYGAETVEPWTKEEILEDKGIIGRGVDRIASSIGLEVGSLVKGYGDIETSEAERIKAAPEKIRLVAEKYGLANLSPEDAIAKFNDNQWRKENKLEMMKDNARDIMPLGTYIESLKDPSKTLEETYGEYAKKPEERGKKAQAIGNQMILQEMESLGDLYDRDAEKAKDSFLKRAWTRSDLTDAISQGITAIRLTGNYELADEWVEKLRSVENTLASDPDQGTVKNLAEGVIGLLPYMGKRAALNAIPIAGSALAFKASAAQGAGDVYAELRESGVEPKLASDISNVAGIAYGLVEKMQLDEVLKMPGASDNIKRGLVQKLAKIIVDRGMPAAKESFEEMIQEAVTQSAIEVGKTKGGVNENTLSQSIGDVIKKSGEAFVSSLATFGLLEGGKGGIAGSYRASKKGAKAAKDKVVDISGKKTWEEMASDLKADKPFMRAVEELSGKKIDDIKPSEGIDIIRNRQDELESIYSKDKDFKGFRTDDNTTADQQDIEPEATTEETQQPIQSGIPGAEEEQIQTEETGIGDKELSVKDKGIGEEPEIITPEEEVDKEEVDKGVTELERELSEEVGEDLTTGEGEIQETQPETTQEEIVPDAPDGDIGPAEQKGIDTQTEVEDIDVTDDNIKDVLKIAYDEQVGESPDYFTPNEKEAFKTINEYKGTLEPQNDEEVLDITKVKDLRVLEKQAKDGLSGLPQSASFTYAVAHSQAKKKPYVVGSIDFNNLGGLNAFFEGKFPDANGEYYSQKWAEKHPEFLDVNGKALKSHSAADIFFKEFWDAYKNGFSGDGDQAYRKGGDEGASISFNKTKDQVEEIMQGIYDKYNKRVNELGLQNLPHPKNKNMPLGTGFDYGLAEVGPEDNGFSKFSEADDEVGKKKAEKMIAISKEVVDKNKNPLYIINVGDGGEPIVESASDKRNSVIADITNKFITGEITEEQFKKEVSNVNGNQNKKMEETGTDANTTRVSSESKQKSDGNSIGKNGEEKTTSSTKKSKLKDKNEPSVKTSDTKQVGQGDTGKSDGVSEVKPKTTSKQGSKTNNKNIKPTTKPKRSNASIIKPYKADKDKVRKLINTNTASSRARLKVLSDAISDEYDVESNKPIEALKELIKVDKDIAELYVLSNYGIKGLTTDFLEKIKDIKDRPQNTYIKFAAKVLGLNRKDTVTKLDTLIKSTSDKEKNKQYKSKLHKYIRYSKPPVKVERQAEIDAMKLAFETAGIKLVKDKLDIDYKAYNDIMRSLENIAETARAGEERVLWVQGVREKIIKKISSKTGKSSKQIVTSNAWKRIMGIQRYGKDGQLIPLDPTYQRVFEGYADEFNTDGGLLDLFEYDEGSFHYDNLIDIINTYAIGKAKIEKGLAEYRSDIRATEKLLELMDDPKRVIASGEIKGDELKSADDDQMLFSSTVEYKDEIKIAHGGSKSYESAIKGLNQKFNKNAEKSGVESTVSRQFKQTKRIDFIGQKATPQNIVDLYTAHRDNKVEHFHIVYTKGDKVVQHTSWSLGAPNKAGVLTKNAKKQLRGKRLHSKIESAMDRLGADGYYLIHNHPTGNTKPSSADNSITRSLSEAVKGFKGHAILDHNHATMLSASNGEINQERIPYSRATTDMTEPKSIVGSQTEAVDFAKQNIVDTNKNGALILLNSQNEVMGFRSLPKNLENNKMRSNPDQADRTYTGLMGELKGNKAVHGIIIASNHNQHLALENIWKNNKGTDNDYVLDVIYTDEDPWIKNSASKYGVGGSASKNMGATGMSYEPQLPFGEMARENLINWHKKSDPVTKMPNGTPRPFYHGTTHEFTEFGDNDFANSEGWLGAGIYLTSSPKDASDNYAGYGPDLTNRIEQKKEQYQYSDMDVYDFAQAMEITEEEAEKYFEDDELTEGGAELLAKKELVGEHEGAVIPVYAKLVNPANISEPGETPISIDIDTEYYVDIAKDEVDRADYDTEEDYEDTIRERAEEIYYEDYDPKEDGNGVEVLEAANQVLSMEEATFVDKGTILSDLRMGLTDQSISDAVELWDFLKNALMDSQDPETGNLNGNELARLIIEGAGFDGIIMDPMIFNMPSVEYGDVHIMIFKGNQAKSAIGNKGLYDENKAALVAEESKGYESNAEQLEADVKPKYTVEAVRKKEHAQLIKDSLRLRKLEAKIDRSKANLKELREFLKLYIASQEQAGNKMDSLTKKQLQVFIEKNPKITEKAVARLKMALVKRVDKAIDKFARKQVAKRLDKIYKRVNKSKEIKNAVIEIDGEDVRLIDQINNILTDDKGIQYVFTGLSNKSREELARRRQMAISEEQLREINDPWLQDALRRENAERIADLSLDKMLQLEQAVLDLLQTAQLMKEVWSSEIYANYQADLDIAKSNLYRNAKKLLKPNEQGVRTAAERKDHVYRIADNIIGTGAVNTEDLAEGIEGLDISDERAVIGKTMFKNFDDALTTYLEFGQAAKDKMADIISWNDVKKISLFTAKNKMALTKEKGEEKGEIDFINNYGIDLKLDNYKGKSLKLAPDQIISLYLHSLNPHNKKAFMDPDMGFMPSHNINADPIAMTEDDFDRVHKIINSNKLLKDIADHISTELNTTNRQALYETSKELNFTPIEIVPMYFPLHRTRIYKDYLTRGVDPTDIAGGGAQSYLEQTGALKGRVQNARGAVVLEGALESFIKSNNLAAAYKAYAKPLRTARQMLADLDADMTNTLNHKAWQRFSEYVEEVSGGKMDKERSTTSAITKQIKGLFSNLVPAALGNNPVVVARQFFSFPVIFSEIGSHNMALAGKAFAELGVNSKAARELKEQLYKYSPQIRARLEGGYANVEMGEKAYGEALNNFYNKPSGLKEKQMMAISAADSFTILRVANVAKKLVEKNNPELSGDAKWEKIADEAEKLIRRTQPMYTKEHRSAMARDKNIFMRMTFAFTSVTQRLYGQLYRALKRFKNASPENKPKEFLRLMNSVVWVDVMSALGMTFIDCLKDLMFRKKVTPEAISKRIIKYSAAPVYLGNQMSSLSVGIYDALVNDGMRNPIDVIIKATSNPDFGRSIDNMAVGYAKDLIIAGRSLSKGMQDLKANDFEDGIKNTIRGIDIVQRGITGLAVGNAKKYTYDMFHEITNGALDTFFSIQARDADYKYMMQKTFTYKGKKYRLKKSDYVALKAIAEFRVEQILNTSEYMRKLDQATTKKERKEVLKSAWKKALNYIKDERNKTALDKSILIKDNVK